MDEPLFVKFLSPPNFRELLCKGSSKTLIADARNHYESQVGHFHGAFLPPIQRFLSLPIYIEKFIRQYKRMFSSIAQMVYAVRKLPDTFPQRTHHSSYPLEEGGSMLISNGKTSTSPKSSYGKARIMFSTQKEV